jgi:hypothetical protein
MCLLLSRCLHHQLELVVSVVIGRNRAVSAAAAASTSALAAVSSTIVSLAALAAVVAVYVAARSRSSVVATLAFCRCCALEATER